MIPIPESTCIRAPCFPVLTVIGRATSRQGRDIVSRTTAYADASTTTSTTLFAAQDHRARSTCSTWATPLTRAANAGRVLVPNDKLIVACPKAPALGPKGLLTVAAPALRRPRPGEPVPPSIDRADQLASPAPADPATRSDAHRASYIMEIALLDGVLEHLGLPTECEGVEMYRPIWTDAAGAPSMRWKRPVIESDRDVHLNHVSWLRRPSRQWQPQRAEDMGVPRGCRTVSYGVQGWPRRLVP